MIKPLVSIIIPFHNAENYMEETIQCVINQTWENKELILIDDGSKDSSKKIAKKFENSWIKIFEQENKGASVARNLGLEYAKGDFIQFLDSDDLLSTNKIETQVCELIKHPKSIAVCSTIHFKNNKDLEFLKPSHYEEKFLFNSDSPADFLINLWGGNDNEGSMVQTNAWLVPKSIIEKAGKWEEFYSPDDDGEYFSRVILASDGIRYVKGCSNYYRKVENGLANRNSYEALNGVYQSTLLKQKNLFKYRNNNNEAKFAIARILIALAVEAYPNHESLSKKIEQDIKELGNYKYIPISGGPIIQKLSFILGWKLARFAQFSYNKVRKIVSNA